MEDFYTTRNTVHHFIVDKVNDEGGEQTRDVTGLEGEKFTEVLHIQPHGFTSVSPKDAHMVGISQGNMRDALVTFGGEHPDHKPKGVKDGDSAMYNAEGALLHLIGKNPTFTGIESFTIKCGSVSYKFSDKGLDVTGGYVKHNGHAIDDTHKHKDTQPGSGETGVPE